MTSLPVSVLAMPTHNLILDRCPEETQTKEGEGPLKVHKDLN